MDSPGKCLKRERELRNLSIEEVSKSTRIKESFLKALEEDRYDLCPPSFYVRGFLTSYARYLGLDPEGILLRYQEWIKPPLPAVEDTVREKPRRTFRFRFYPILQPGMQVRMVFPVLLASVLLVLGLISFYPSVTPQPAKVPNTLPPAPKESASPEAIQKKEEHPVIDQIKQIELIGPKAVQADVLYEVADARLGTGIETEDGRLKLVGRGAEFRCENQRVYFFTRIGTPKEGKVFHVWRWEGEEQYRLEMAVKPPSWSVYSYISLVPSRSGKWKVEVWADGRMLTDVSFQAHPPKGTSSPS